jgi:hypothetical protein
LIERLPVLGLCGLVLGCSAPRDEDDFMGAGRGSTSGGSGTNHAGGVPAAGAGTVSAAAGAAGMPSASGGAPVLTPSGGSSSGAGVAGGGGAPPQPPTDTCDFPYQELVDVSSAQALANALGSAGPGTLIRLSNGEIRGEFTASKSGSAAAPIVLCGTRQAVLSAGTGSSETVLTLTGDYWVVSGFSVVGGQKGVLLDGANHNLLTSLSVHGTGNEAVHFRSASSDNILEWSEIFDTGKASAEFGEGVYIGSAVSQWEKFTGSANVPDRSDRNVIRNNEIGPNVRAELIDVKEGTTGGSIADNTFNGAGIVSDGFADSWIDVKGNGYSITGNQGTDSPADGFQVHVVEGGWGNGNTFRKNRATVNADGYGFRISADASGTVVSCDNVVMGAGAGLSNIGCQN